MMSDRFQPGAAMSWSPRMVPARAFDEFIVEAPAMTHNPTQP